MEWLVTPAILQYLVNTKAEEKLLSENYRKTTCSDLLVTYAISAYGTVQEILVKLRAHLIKA